MQNTLLPSYTRTSGSWLTTGEVGEEEKRRQGENIKMEKFKAFAVPHLHISLIFIYNNHFSIAPCTQKHTQTNGRSYILMYICIYTHTMRFPDSHSHNFPLEWANNAGSGTCVLR